MKKDDSRADRWQWKTQKTVHKMISRNMRNREDELLQHKTVQWRDQIYKAMKNRKCKNKLKGSKTQYSLLTQSKGSAGVAFNVSGLLLLLPPPPTPPQKRFSKHRYLRVSHHTQKSNYYQHTEVSSFVA